MSFRDAQTELTDPRAIRALAHPGRIEILGHLRRRGPATATECAGPAGLSPSACSYHLRTLARWGFVGAAPSEDGRERRWRALGSGLRWDVAGKPREFLAASHLLTSRFLERGLELRQEYLEHEDELEPAWRGADDYRDDTLLLTREELDELDRRLDGLLEPYRRGRAEVPAGAREVHFVAFAVPRR